MQDLWIFQAESQNAWATLPSVGTWLHPLPWEAKVRKMLVRTGADSREGRGVDPCNIIVFPSSWK